MSTTKSSDNSSNPSSLNRLKKESSKITKQQAKELNYHRREEAKEKREQLRKDSYFNNTNDQLTFADFYKMSSNIYSYPNPFIWVGLFISCMIFYTPLAFDLLPFIEPYIPINWQTFLVLLAIVYVIPISLNLVKAFRLKAAFNQLPFELNGLGMLVHRCEGRNYFRRCSIRLTWDPKNGKTSVSDETIHEIEQAFLQLVVNKARKMLFRKRILNAWSINENKAIGHANWAIAGKILLSLHKHLSPVQSELGILKSVEIEFPKGKSDNDDYYEWTAEGD